MGILTSPSVGNNSKRLAEIIVKYERPASPLLYVCGLIWFTALAYHPFNAGTYFSENALLPGLVNNDFTDGHDILDTLDQLKAVASKGGDAITRKWIRERFQQLGLEVFSQNFSAVLPLSNATAASGENMYAVLRAPRGSSTEGLVFSVPYRPVGTQRQPHGLAGISLLISMAKYFRRQIYWAKDVVFLVSDQEWLGVSAWLSAYHRVPASSSQWLHAGPLPSRVANIQAAVNLETLGDVIDHVDVAAEGLDGQLPNLDLVKLAHWICHQERLPHTSQQRFDYSRPDSWEGLLYSLRTLFSMMYKQASGRASGNHGYFHQYNIQAVTLRAGPRVHGSSSASRTSLKRLARVVEGVFRSLNNLQERFHQSFFFYLMPATGRYISIGLYMPPFALVAVGVALKALSCWLQFSYPELSADQPQPPPTHPDSQTGSTQGSVEGCVTSLVSTLIAAHACGLLVYYCLPVAVALLAARGGAVSHQPAEVALSLAAVISLIPAALIARYSDGRRSCTSLQRCATLMQLSLLLFCTALFNISLALLIAVLYTPLSLLLPHANRARLRCAALCACGLAATHPLLLMCVLWERRDSVWSAGGGPGLLEAVLCCVLLPVWTQMCAQLLLPFLSKHTTAHQLTHRKHD